MNEKVSDFEAHFKYMSDSFSYALKHLKSYRSALFFYLLSIGIVGGGIIGAIDDIGFLNGFFLMVSGVTGSGLTPVSMQDLSTGSFILLVMAMIAGMTPLIPCWSMLYRRYVYARIMRANKNKNTEDPVILEYELQDKAIRFMIIRVVGYALFWIVFGFVSLSLALRLQPREPELVERNIGTVANAAFVTVSAFANAGYTLSSGSCTYWKENPLAYFLLTIVMLVGNNLLPVSYHFYLQFELSVRRKYFHISDKDKEVIKFVLSNPRRIMVHLFAQSQTYFILYATILMNVVQFFLYLVSTLTRREALREYGSRATLTGMGYFQTISTRMTGVQIMDLRLMNQGMLVVYLIAMYLNGAPFMSALSNSKEDSYRPAVLADLDSDDEEGEEEEFEDDDEEEGFERGSELGSARGTAEEGLKSGGPSAGELEMAPRRYNSVPLTTTEDSLENVMVSVDQLKDSNEIEESKAKEANMISSSSNDNINSNGPVLDAKQQNNNGTGLHLLDLPPFAPKRKRRGYSADDGSIQVRRVESAPVSEMLSTWFRYPSPQKQRSSNLTVDDRDASSKEQGKGRGQRPSSLKSSRSLSGKPLKRTMSLEYFDQDQLSPVSPSKVRHRGARLERLVHDKPETITARSRISLMSIVPRLNVDSEDNLVLAPENPRKVPSNTDPDNAGSVTDGHIHSVAEFVPMSKGVQMIFRHSFFIFCFYFILAFTEDKFLTYNTDVNLFYLLFEVISAYGNVGLSLSLPGQSFSMSGNFKTVGKLCIICLMLLGKCRGLPRSSDAVIDFRFKRLVVATDPPRRRTRRRRAMSGSISSLAVQFPESSKDTKDGPLSSPSLVGQMNSRNKSNASSSLSMTGKRQSFDPASFLANI